MSLRKAVRRALSSAVGGVSDDLLRELARQWVRASWQREVHERATWMGFPILQWPTDMMVIQDIIFEQRPRVIVETGTHRGGSAVYLASLLRLLGGDKVVSVDVRISDEVRQAIAESPFGEMITLVWGDSKSPEVLAEVEQAVGGERNALVVLDSDHSRSHVLAELSAYFRFVPLGGYMIVMDTICHDLWDVPRGSPDWAHDNPLAAVADFLQEHPEFEVDRAREKFLVTYAQGGFLKRVR